MMISCFRANEFESGCMDGMSCACTVEVNCAPPKHHRIDKEQDQSRRATEPGTDEVLCIGSLPYHEASNKSEWFFSSLKVQTAGSNLSSEPVNNSL